MILFPSATFLEILFNSSSLSICHQMRIDYQEVDRESAFYQTIHLDAMKQLLPLYH